MRADLLDAVSIAKDVAPFRYARLSAMKLATDPKPDPLNSMSREELRLDIVRRLEEMGLYLITAKPEEVANQ